MTRTASLLLAGVAALTCSGPLTAGAKGRTGPPPLARLAEELDLDPAQRARLEEIQDRLVKRRGELGAEAGYARYELRKLLRDDGADRAQVLAKVDELGRLRTEMKKLAVAARLDRRDVLTAEQRLRLDRLREERRERRQDRREQRRAGRRAPLPPDGEPIEP